MENIRVCEYGCGKEAPFQLKNGKWCCSESCNKCEAVRKKNSEGLRKAHKDGKVRSFSFESSEKGRKTRRKELYQNFLDNPNKFYSSGTIRYYLIYSGRPYECECCKISEWNGKPISLEVDHVDGNHSNNRLSNLRYLCPNCHSQTSTYKGRNINTGRKIVSDEDLKKALAETKTIRQALIKAGLSPEGANYARAKKLMG